MIATNLSSKFKNWYGVDGDFEHSMQVYGFKVRVLIVKDIPARHPMFDYIRNIGIKHINSIFSGNGFEPSEHELFVFPERHLSVQEQYQFLYKIAEWTKENPNRIKELDIITSCPAIVSDTPNGSARIIEFPKDTVDKYRYAESETGML